MPVNKSQLPAEDCLQLLRKIASQTARFRQEEKRAARESRIRGRGIEHRHQEALEALETELREEHRRVDDEHQAAQAFIDERKQHRESRLREARGNLEFSMPRRSREEKEEWMGHQQHRHMEAGRHLAREREALDEQFHELSKEIEYAWQSWQELFDASRHAFRGFGFLRRRLARPLGESDDPLADSVPPAEELEKFQQTISRAWLDLSRFEKQPLARLFRYVPLLIWVIAALALAGGLAYGLGNPAANEFAWLPAGIAGGGLLVFSLALHAIARKQCVPPGLKLCNAIEGAGERLSGLASSLEERHEKGQAQLQSDYENTCAEIQNDLDRTNDVVAAFEAKTRADLETRATRIQERIETAYDTARTANDAKQEQARQQLTEQEEKARRKLEKEFQTNLFSGNDTEKDAWQDLLTGWQETMHPLYSRLHAVQNAINEATPEWDILPLQPWHGPDHFLPVTRFGQFHLDLNELEDGLPQSPELALPGAARLQAPAALIFPKHGSLLLETDGGMETPVVATLNQCLLRRLAGTPPGRISLTLIEPVTLGQSFAALMHLGDHEESLINRRIWTQRDQIEKRLSELSEHIEKVIQMYLRNDYETITEYNEKAGSIAEKFHILVITDFPATISETAAADLRSILSSGPRCGVYTFIHRNRSQPLPDGLSEADLTSHMVRIRYQHDQWHLDGMEATDPIRLAMEPPPDPKQLQALIEAIGKASASSSRVEVPFSQIAPSPDERWQLETVEELRIPIGRTGATKKQLLAIGKGTRQHALFAGKTGSGKSTLFHVIITNLALACSPDQVEFYLIDFKKGVEFKCYANQQLPHARVVAIESDREFALSVLQRVDAELKRRGDLFRKAGVQDLAGYQGTPDAEPMPRSLLLIDEFQEFFVEEDSVAQEASLLFDRIVRQGRAFGIHVLLGSQTLGGAYSLARATLGQMAIRVALQCNEADALLIMDENNPAPRLLSRPGEGIYNDAGGALEGNSPFQVVWLPEPERDELLKEIRQLGNARGFEKRRPTVFEGNAPAAIEENDPLADALDSEPEKAPATARIWLGTPNAIKGPTELPFTRQSGHHALMIGAPQGVMQNLTQLALLSLAAQHPADKAKFYVLRAGSSDSTEIRALQQLLEQLPHESRLVRPADINGLMTEFSEEQQRRLESDDDPEEQPRWFLFIHGLQQFKKLRPEDQFAFDLGDVSEDAKIGGKFQELLNEGSSVGLHLFASIDTLNNVNRSLNRKALAEFSLRILFQMSANDSATLIDSPKASTLGLHRAILYNENEGTLETFRPYGEADGDWMQGAIDQITKRAPADQSLAK